LVVLGFYIRITKDKCIMSRKKSKYKVSLQSSSSDDDDDYDEKQEEKEELTIDRSRSTKKQKQLVIQHRLFGNYDDENDNQSQSSVEDSQEGSLFKDESDDSVDDEGDAYVEEDSDTEDDEEDDDDDDYDNKMRTRRRSNRGKKTRSTILPMRRSARNHNNCDRPDYNEAINEESGSEEEEEEEKGNARVVPAKRKSHPKTILSSATTIRNNKRTKNNSDSNSDSEEECEDNSEEEENSEDEREGYSRRSTRRSRRTISSDRSKNKADSIRKSPRKSIRETKKRISKITYEEESTDEEDEESNNEFNLSDGDDEIEKDIQDKSKKFSPKKKITTKDDDSSFHESSENEEEGEESDYSDEDFEMSERVGAKKQIFNDDISFEDEVDDSDNEDEKSDSRNTRRRLCRVTPLVVRRSTRTALRSDSSDEYESFDEDESDSSDNPNDGSIRNEKKRTRVQTTPQKHAPICYSANDEITLEKLSPVHICYLAPDGKTRHCFNLSTIYKASLMSGLQRHNNNGGIALLQPPHFRSLMDDNLLDQVASRFGRTALIIEESEVYKKDHNAFASRNNFGSTMFDDSDASGDDGASFRTRFERFLQKQMGHGDLYCCPICYAEASRRFRGKDADDDENSDFDEDDNSASNDYSLDAVTASKIDPMTILGGLDEDEFGIASEFCFGKLASVKQHIRSVHEVDPSSAANDLFQRFQIRAQDGLLQSHLIAFWKSRLYNGAMQSYWREGHNQSYILLRILVENRRGMTESRIDAADDDDDDYCKSFVNRAKKIWGTLMAPYAKCDDVNDFIDDDEDVEDFIRPVFQKPESDVEEQFIEHLRQKQKYLGSSDSQNSSEESPSDSDGISDMDQSTTMLQVREHDSERSSSEDEYNDSNHENNLKKYQSKSAKESKPRGTRIRSKLTRESDVDENIFSVDVGNQVHKSSDNDEIITSPVARRRQILSSDEE